MDSVVGGQLVNKQEEAKPMHDLKKIGEAWCAAVIPAPRGRARRIGTNSRAT